MATQTITITQTKGYWKGGHYISRGLTGYWSKWGGAREVVIKEKIADTWVCQSCSREQPKELTPYMYEFLKNEYIRICHVCLHDGCQELHSRLQTLE